MMERGVSAEIGSVLRRSMGPRGPIYSSGEVSVFVVLVWRLSFGSVTKAGYH